MNRNIDNLGRIVIPKEMRTQLDIKENDPLNIELQDNKIIITKPDTVDYKAIIKEAIEDLKFNQYKAEIEENDVEYDLFQTTIDILNKGL